MQGSLEKICALKCDLSLNWNASEFIMTDGLNYHAEGAVGGAPFCNGVKLRAVYGNWPVYTPAMGGIG